MGGQERAWVKICREGSKSLKETVITGTVLQMVVPCSSGLVILIPFFSCDSLCAHLGHLLGLWILLAMSQHDDGQGLMVGDPFLEYLLALSAAVQISPCVSPYTGNSGWLPNCLEPWTFSLPGPWCCPCSCSFPWRVEWSRSTAPLNEHAISHVTLYSKTLLKC